MDQGGQKYLKNALQPVPVRRLNFHGRRAPTAGAKWRRYYTPAPSTTTAAATSTTAATTTRRGGDL